MKNESNKNDCKNQATIFEQIRDEYEKAREEERLALVEYLEEHLKKCKDCEFLYVISKSRAGKGIKNYTNNGTIAEFNLNNWKWVEVKSKYNTFDCIISLNMIDADHKTGAFHALYDRIGLIIISSDKFPYKKHICTNMDLPLNDEKRECIFELLVKEYSLYAKG